jgi:hypothetical protein
MIYIYIDSEKFATQFVKKYIIKSNILISILCIFETYFRIKSDIDVELKVVQCISCFIKFLITLGILKYLYGYCMDYLHELIHKLIYIILIESFSNIMLIIVNCEMDNQTKQLMQIQNIFIYLYCISTIITLLIACELLKIMNNWELYSINSLRPLMLFTSNYPTISRLNSEDNQNQEILVDIE